MTSLSQMNHEPSSQGDGHVDVAPMLASVTAEIERQLLIAIRLQRTDGAIWPPTPDEQSRALLQAQRAVAGVNFDRIRQANKAAREKAVQCLAFAAKTAKEQNEDHSRADLCNQAVDTAISVAKVADIAMLVLAEHQAVLLGGGQ